MVTCGLDDLYAQRYTPKAWLVVIASQQLKKAGLINDFEVLPGKEAELELYNLLKQENGDAYSKYNALLRELDSFLNALDRYQLIQHQSNLLK